MIFFLFILDRSKIKKLICVKGMQIFWYLWNSTAYSEGDGLARKMLQKIIRRMHHTKQSIPSSFRKSTLSVLKVEDIGHADRHKHTHIHEVVVMFFMRQILQQCLKTVHFTKSPMPFNEEKWSRQVNHRYQNIKGFSMQAYLRVYQFLRCNKPS